MPDAQKHLSKHACMVSGSSSPGRRRIMKINKNNTQEIGNQPMPTSVHPLQNTVCSTSPMKMVNMASVAPTLSVGHCCNATSASTSSHNLALKAILENRQNLATIRKEASFDPWRVNKAFAISSIRSLTLAVCAQESPLML